MVTQMAPDAAKFMTQLRRYRLAAGLDQTGLARKVGVSVSAVSLWESGKCIPKGKMFPKIARVLGIKAIELTQLIDPETPRPGQMAK
jgi:transcriptional regulator with XRE-family HTH domain